MRKQRISRIAVLTSLFLVFNLFFPGLMEPVFARDGPGVEIFVHGEKSKGGAIFNTSGEMGNGMWAPGVENSGIMRVYNDYSDRVSIHNLGIKLKLHNTITGEEVREPAIIKEYSEAMELRITKGVLLVFENDIYDSNFYNMLYDKDSGSQKGHELSLSNRISIAKGASVDLKYTVRMNKSAGNNLQGLKAVVDFIVNSQEDTYNKPPVDNEDDDKDRDDKSDNLIEEPLNKIPDIGGHWAHDCIVALIEHEVLVPDSNGSVRPEDYITRAEAAVLMGKALKLEEINNISTGYVDNVPTWARGYVIATTKARVFKGYPGKVFKSYGNITREEMTAVLLRAFREASTSDREMDFNDKNKISNWARGNVAKSVEEGIVTGYPEDNTFRPKAYMTRAEAFTIVCKLLGYHEEHNKKLSSIHQP